MPGECPRLRYCVELEKGPVEVARNHFLYSIFEGHTYMVCVHAFAVKRQQLQWSIFLPLDTHLVPSNAWRHLQIALATSSYV